MAIFAVGVSGEYPWQSEFIPPFKLRTRRLECLGSTWHNRINEYPSLDKKKNNFYFLTLENDNWFNFYFVLVSLNKKIASVEQGNSRLYLERN